MIERDKYHCVPFFVSVSLRSLFLDVFVCLCVCVYVVEVVEETIKDLLKILLGELWPNDTSDFMDRVSESATDSPLEIERKGEKGLAQKMPVVLAEGKHDGWEVESALEGRVGVVGAGRIGRTHTNELVQ